MNLRMLTSCLVLPALLAACSEPEPVALGTIERDHIDLPAPISERIARIAVREGDTVVAGQVLIELEDTRTRARYDAALAEAQRAAQALEEARNGPRDEQIARAQAQAAVALAEADRARRERARIEPLVASGVLSATQGDAARAADQGAQATLRAQRAVLAELERGTRSEAIAQAESALAAAQAQVDAVTVDLERVHLAAPRAGVVDSLPFEVGDQRPAGTALATLLVGDTPYARVYVPQTLRAELAIGDAATVRLHGSAVDHAGRVRAIRQQPAFTPYYALLGSDASRLVWLAEVELEADAADLPLGMPVSAHFDVAASP